MGQIKCLDILHMVLLNRFAASSLFEKDDKDEEKKEAGTTEVDDDEADEVTKIEPVVFVIGSAPRFLPRLFISSSSDMIYATRQDGIGMGGSPRGKYSCTERERVDG